MRTIKKAIRKRGKINYQKTQGDSSDESVCDSLENLASRLSSYNDKVRELATSMLINLSDSIDAKDLKQIYDHQCLKTLVERLSDPNMQVILNTLYAINNLISLDDEVNLKQNASGKLLHIGVLHFLENLWQHSLAELQSLMSNKQQKEQIVAIVNAIFSLYSKLLETAELSQIGPVISSKICEYAVSFLETCDNDMIMERVMNFLHVATECSADLCLAIANNQNAFGNLMIIAENTELMNEIRSYVLAIIYNIVSALDVAGKNTDGNFREKVVKVLSESVESSMGVAIFDELSNLREIIQASNKSKNMKKMNQDSEIGLEDTVEDIEDSELEVDAKTKSALKIWQQTASSIKISLGLLITVFETDEFEDEEVIETESINSDFNEETNNQAENILESSLYTKDALGKYFESEGFVRCLINKLRNTKIDDLKALCEISNLFMPVANDFNEIMSLAVCVLSNILDKNQKSYSQELVGAIVDTLWTDFEAIFARINKNKSLVLDSHDQNIMVSKMQLLVMLLQRDENLAGKIACAKFVEFFENAYKTGIEELIMLTLDTIFLRFAPRFGITMEENMKACEILLCCMNDKNLAIVGQGLNGMFEIYVDETYDQNYRARNLQSLLESGYTEFRNKIKESKGQGLLRKDKLKFLQSTLINLKAFIKYKAVHAK